MKRLISWLPIAILGSLLLLFLYFRLDRYLNIASITHYQAFLKQWTISHYFQAVATYLAIFMVILACTIPGSSLLSLIGGFLFGLTAFFYAVFATTIGGLMLCLAVRCAIGESSAKRRYRWIKNVERGFQKHAFYYLLMLRIMPFCPCWVSNISAGALNVPIRTFLVATIIGVSPATLVYVMAGRSLEQIIATSPNGGNAILTSPSIFLPLIAIFILSLAPFFYKMIKKSNQT